MHSGHQVVGRGAGAVYPADIQPSPGSSPMSLEIAMSQAVSLENNISPGITNELRLYFLDTM